MIHPPPTSTLFPYTTLFRSCPSVNPFFNTCFFTSSLVSASPSEKISQDKSKPSFQMGKRSEEHTSELQSRGHLVCRLLLEKKKRQARSLFGDVNLNDVRNDD